LKHGGYLRRPLHFDGDGSQLVAQRESVCGKCTQRPTCGAGLLVKNAPLTGVHQEILAEVPYEARFPAALLLRICLFTFPVGGLLLLTGASLAQHYFPTDGDLAAAAGALLGLLVGAAALKLYDSAFGRRGSHTRLVIVPSTQGSAEI